MNIDLSGRIAVVTGGSKGIGFAVASRFAAEHPPISNSGTEITAL